MTLTVYEELEQGSPEWHTARCGLMTASELNLILSPTLKVANNEKTRKHVYELAAQRINQYVEPTYIGDNMLRGWADEIKAREIYSQRFQPITEVGGMCRDFGDFKLWCSPDGLVGEDGGIEAKSRIQKYQIETITKNEVPEEHALQVQSALAVTKRSWWDYVSYSGGMPMWVIRCEPIEKFQDAIKEACTQFEEKVKGVMSEYEARLKDCGDIIQTEREIEQEVYVG